jgi:2-C-methyl-D-erythritol 4-phosphate cytidylyltransferase
MRMSLTTAIIVAAGKGTRMGPNIDKLFLEVAGKPVIAHTWRVFDSSPVIDEIVLVVRDPV